MKKKALFLFSALTLLAVVSMPVASFATTTATASSQVQALLDQIKTLQAQIQALQNLQSQITTTKSQINETLQLARSLRQGMSGEDVTTLQEILAADPEVYPEGLITGYFGSLTENAVKKFQKKHGIEQVGEVGPKTKMAINQFLSSVTASPGAKIPPGLAKKLNYNYSYNYNNASSSAYAAREAGTMTICHYPGGNHNARHTITIGTSAWPAHQAHGDTIGACDGTTPNDPVNPPADTTSPVISGIGTLNLKATSTDIIWTTNEQTTSRVWFGTTTPVQSNLASSTLVSSTSLVTSHSLPLVDLATSTSYYFLVVSSDAAGNTATSSQSSFVTPAQ